MSVQPSSDMTCGHTQTHATIIKIYFSISFRREQEKLFSFVQKVRLSTSGFNEGNNYKKYRHPRQSNVVEGDRALERVITELRAIGVVLIPVNA